MYIYLNRCKILAAFRTPYFSVFLCGFSYPKIVSRYGKFRTRLKGQRSVSIRVLSRLGLNNELTRNANIVPPEATGPFQIGRSRRL